MARFDRRGTAGTILIGLLAGTVTTHAQQRFEQPGVDGVRIDWCLAWGADCGKPAADRFCRDRGLPGATKFEIARAVGPTRVLGSGQACTDRRCDGFAFIECAPRQVPLVRPDARIVQPASGRQREARPAAGEPALRSADLNFGTFFTMTALPPGAKLWWVAGDIQTAMDFAAKGGSQMFYWSVAKVPGAQGVVWQINRSPFPPFRAGDPSVLDPPGLVASGRDARVDGVFNASFANLPKPSLSARPSLKAPRPIPWYVRVLPVSGGNPPVVVGQPSNFVRVFDSELPPAPPSDVKLPPTTDKPAAKVSLVRFEYRPYWSEDRWPAGCSTGPPPEDSIFEKAWDSFADVWSGVTEAYNKAKSLVVDLASTLTGGVIPRSILNTALTTALVAAGVPPDIPNLDQVMNEGADYLAAALTEQVVGPAADDIISGLAKQYNIDPNLGPEQVKQIVTAKVRESSKQAVLDAAAAASKPRSGWYACQGRLHLPQITLTLRNVDPGGHRITRLTVENEADVFQPKSFSVVIEPGETLTIPVPLLPNIPQKYNKSQMPSWDDAKNADHWRENIYKKQPARFVVKSSGGERCWVVDDGLAGCTPLSGGLSYTTPSRTWHQGFDDRQPQSGPPR